MKIDTNDLIFLKRSLLANKCVLFLGAGFSLDAQNRKGEGIPTGKELLRRLWILLGYTGEPEKDATLQKIFDLALKRKKKDLIPLLEECYKCERLSDWHHHVPLFYWYRIYTTNIDDVVECAYHTNNSI